MHPSYVPSADPGSEIWLFVDLSTTKWPLQDYRNPMKSRDFHDHTVGRQPYSERPPARAPLLGGGPARRRLTLEEAMRSRQSRCPPRELAQPKPGPAVAATLVMKATCVLYSNR